jgi:hypothetical protein
MAATGVAVGAGELGTGDYEQGSLDLLAGSLAYPRRGGASARLRFPDLRLRRPGLGRTPYPNHELPKFDPLFDSPPPRAQPNPAVVRLYGNRTFQRLVRNQAIECTEIADTLQDAAGGAGRQITINPAPGTPVKGQVRWPTSRGPASGNFHTVYADQNFVYDPRYRPTPIPIAEWEAEVNALNGGANVFGR